MDKFADKFRINSARLANWNYSSPGNYFLTVCTCNHNKFFGKIDNEKMVSSKMGMIANQFLSEIPKHFANVCLKASIVMPNHVHILVRVETPYMASPLQKNFNIDTKYEPPFLNSKINENYKKEMSKITQSKNIFNKNINYELKVANFDNCKISANQKSIKETPYMASLHGNRKITLINYSYKNHPNYFPQLSEKSKQLIPKIIQQYKSAVTRQINPKTVFFGWQSGYYCIIVKDEVELLKIKNYIINNPKNWQNDKFYN